MAHEATELLEQGKAAISIGRWEDAESLLRDAVAADPSPECVDALGRLLYCKGDYDESLDYRERAYSGFRARGDDAAAAVVACWLSYVQFMVYGNEAAANGWVSRARSLIDGSVESPELGLVTLFLAYYSSDPEEKAAGIQEATRVARRYGDTSLEFLARSDAGMLLIEEGRIAEGMALLDEAVTAASSGEVTEIEMASVIFCQMMRACELVRDTRRASQWMAVQATQSERRGVDVSTNIHCRTYYGGVLTAAGRWQEAESELEALTRAYTDRYLGFSSAAAVRLADLRVLQGRFEDAERLLAGFEDDPQAVRPVVRLHAARGELEVAATRLRRHLALFGDGVLQAPEIALLIEVETAAGGVPEAEELCQHLVALAETTSLRLVRALAEFASGTVCGAAHRPETVQHLERALAGFVELGLPYEEARTRMALARELLAKSPQVAINEARLALERFETLSARRDADAAAALLRQLGATGRAKPRSETALTRREQEVLALLGEGLSNDELAERLVISRRTAEHHVSNILEKLGVRSRADAALYASREAGRSPAQR